MNKCFCDMNAEERSELFAYECDIHVSCDKNCKAPKSPTDNEGLVLAYEHWRRHRHMGGCSHGH